MSDDEKIEKKPDLVERLASPDIGKYGTLLFSVLFASMFVFGWYDFRPAIVIGLFGFIMLWSMQCHVKRLVNSNETNNSE